MYDEEKNIISLLFFIILKLGLIFYFIYHIAFNGFGVFNYKNFYEIYDNKKPPVGVVFYLILTTTDSNSFFVSGISMMA